MVAAEMKSQLDLDRMVGDGQRLGSFLVAFHSSVTSTWRRLDMTDNGKEALLLQKWLRYNATIWTKQHIHCKKDSG